MSMFWRGIVGYLPANIAQGLVGFLTIIVFTRLLSAEQYGAFALAFSAMSLGHTLVFTWLEAAISRFYAQHDLEGRVPDLVHTLLRTWAVLVVIYPCLVGLAIWLIPMRPGVQSAVLVATLIVMVRSLSRLAQERRRAAGQVRATTLMDMTITLGGFGIGVAFAIAGFGGAAPFWGIGLGALVTVLATAPKDFALFKKGKWEPGLVRDAARYGIPVAVSLILTLAMASLDRILLSAHQGEASVGAYHAGYSLAFRTLDVMFMWLGMAGGPALIAALDKQGRDVFERVARQQVSLMIMITVPAAAGLALVARPLGDLMIGPELRAGAVSVTPWVCMGALASGFTTYYLHQAFTLGRRTHLLTIAMSAPAIANLCLNLVLIPRFGSHGAAWATAASFSFGALVSWTLGRRSIHLPIPLDVIRNTALSVVTMTAAIWWLPTWGGLAELALKALVGALAYACVTLALDTAGTRTELSRVLKQFRARRLA
jgi:O-antigen/teichoic acid export membrane protein